MLSVTFINKITKRRWTYDYVTSIETRPSGVIIIIDAEKHRYFVKKGEYTKIYCEPEFLPFEEAI